MTELDILYERISRYTIKLPSNTDINNIQYIKSFTKQFIEQSLNYQATTLYIPLYTNKLVYQLNINNEYITATLLKSYDKQLKSDMIMVNDY